MNPKLKNWLDKIYAGLIATDFSDVHIDTLANNYQNGSRWILGIIELLKEALDYSTSKDVHGLLAGALALRSSEDYIGINYQTCCDLEREFCMTPPSIYFFREGKCPWRVSNLPFQAVTIVDFPINPSIWRLLHLEYRENTEPEYRRSLWVVPK